MTVSDLFIKYIEHRQLYGDTAKTALNYKDTLSCFMRLIGDLPVGLIDIEVIEAWLYRMKEDGIKTNTLNCRLGHVRRVLRYAKERGFDTMDTQSIRFIKRRQRPPKLLTSDEVARMINACDLLRDKLLISLLFSTMCRITEALSIDTDDIRGEVVTVVGKNSKYRPVYLDDRTRILLDKYLASRDDGLAPLFITIQDTRLTASRAQQIISNAAEKAGINKKTYPHLFRHSSATDKLEKGMDVRVLQEAMGHNTITTTQVYTHVSDKMLIDNLKRYNKT